MPSVAHATLAGIKKRNETEFDIEGDKASFHPDGAHPNILHHLTHLHRLEKRKVNQVVLQYLNG